MPRRPASTDDEFDLSDVDGATAALAAGSITQRDYVELMQELWGLYTLMTIEDRAIPRAEDGMLPTNRRAIWGAFSVTKATPGKPHVKAARIVGDVMGNFHPHGDCLDGSTLIMGADDQEYRLDQLTADGVAELPVYASTADGLMVVARAHSFRVGQYASETYVITLADGSEIRATENHPFRLPDGSWVKAGDLAVGDPVTMLNISAEDRPDAYVDGRKIGSVAHCVKVRRSPNPDRTIRHHRDENPRNNDPSNIMLMTRAEHAAHHGDFRIGLDKGRQTMFADGTPMRAAIREKNSRMMVAYNRVAPLVKACKIRDAVIASGRALTPDSYNSERLKVYNGPTIARLVASGHLSCFDDLAAASPMVDVSDAIGLTADLRKTKAKPARRRMAPRIGDHARSRLAMCEIVQEMLLWHDLTLVESDWDVARKRLIDFHGSGEGNIFGRIYPKLGSKMIPGSLSEVLQDVVGHGVNFVVAIRRQKHRKPVPMYDFTVDGYENLFVSTGTNSLGEKTGVCVHNSSIYNSLVRQAQPFSVQHPLFDFHGNYGHPDFEAAASRYTEARLSAIAMAMLDGISENAVDMVPNYGQDLVEPVVLPARIPLALVNNVSAIAVSQATNTMTNNLTEVLNAALAMVRNPKITLDELLEYVAGPDLPQPCTIFGTDGIRSVYESGFGQFVMRARYHIEPHKTGRGADLVFTGLPMNTSHLGTIEKIADLIANKDRAPLASASGVRNEANRKTPPNEARIVVSFKNADDIEAALPVLWHRTDLQKKFSVMNKYLVDSLPVSLGLKQLLAIWLDHRRSVITRQTHVRREKAARRLEVVEGLILASSIIDQVIALIRSSKSRQHAQERMVAGDKIIGKVKFTQVQAEAICSMQLGSLSQLDIYALENEKKELEKKIKHYDAVLSSTRALNNEVAKEIEETLVEFPAERRCEIVDMNLADLDAETPARTAAAAIDAGPGDPAVFHLTNKLWGWTTDGTDTEPVLGKGNSVVQSWETMSGLAVNILTADGQAWRVAASTFAGASAQPIAGVIQARSPITAFPDNEFGSVVLATASGGVKRVLQSELQSRRAGQFASKGVPILKFRDEGDTLVGATRAFGDAGDVVVLMTNYGNVLAFPASDLMTKGATAGVIPGIKLNFEGEVVIGVATVEAASIIAEGDEIVYDLESSLATIVATTSLGRWRSVYLAEFDIKSRGQKPVPMFPKLLDLDNGEVVTSFTVNNGYEGETTYMISKAGGVAPIKDLAQAVRTGKTINENDRLAGGGSLFTIVS